MNELVINTIVGLLLDVVVLILIVPLFLRGLVFSGILTLLPGARARIRTKTDAQGRFSITQYKYFGIVMFVLSLLGLSTIGYLIIRDMVQKIGVLWVP